MSQETLNIIIGALIGFVPSAILALVTLRFQMYQKETERKWYLEDKKKNREKEIMENRLNQIELIATEEFKWFIMIDETVYKPLYSDDEKEYSEFFKSIWTVGRLDSSIPSIGSVQNIDIVLNWSQLVKAVKNTRDLISKTRKEYLSAEDKEQVKKKFNQGFDKFRNEGQKSLSAIIIALDKIRKEYW